MSKKELFDKWVDRVMAYAAEVGPKINCHIAPMQSAPILDKQCDILFLGINPAEGGWDYGDPEKEADYARKRFYEGNNPEGWHKRWDWVFNPENPNNSFTKAGWGDAVRKGNYNFFNIIFFGSAHGGTDIPFEEVKQCADFAAEAITDIFRPKCVICISISEVFDRLNATMHFDQAERMKSFVREDGKPMNYRVMRGEKDGIRFYGIPHFTGYWRVTKADFNAIVAAIHKDMSNI